MSLDFNSNFIAGISGAVLGAVVGGLIAFILQRRAQSEERKLRKETKKERQDAMAYSLTLKMLKMHSNIVNFHDHIETHIARTDTEGAQKRPWMIVPPLASHPEKIHFTIDELAFLLSLKDMDIANDILPLDGVHNALVGAFEKFSEKSDTLRGMMWGKETGKPYELSTEMSDQEYQRFLPKIVELDSLIQQLRASSSKEAHLYWTTLVSLTGLFKDKIGFVMNLELKSDTERRP